MAQGAQVPTYGNRGSEQLHFERNSGDGSKPIRSTHKRSASRDGSELRNITDSPADPDSARYVSNKSDSEPPKPRHERRLSRDESDSRKSNDSSKKVTRIEPSPLDPHNQSKLVNKSSTVSSPSSERKGASDSSNGLTPVTPGRSRLRSVTRGDDSPDDSPTVPKFGDWDDNDPASGEGFTQVFERVSQEKQSGGGKVPTMANETSYANGQKRYGNDIPKGCGCFPWGGK